MKSLRLFVVLLCLMCVFAVATFAQVANDFRTAQSGNWEDLSSWQRYTGSSWVAATFLPDSSFGKIDILPGHTITVNSNIVVDSVYVDSSSIGGSGGSLIIMANDTVTVGPPNAKTPTELGVNVQAAGQTYGGTMIVYGCYKHARNGGSWPMATWAVGSTCLTSPGTVSMTTVPNNRNQAWYNFEWNCPVQSGNLAINLTGLNDTIHGNFVVRATGASGRLYLTSPGTTSQIYAAPIHIMGDLIIYKGQFASNGSGSYVWAPLTRFEIYVHGSILVPGSGRTLSWFAIGRGSGNPVTFYVGKDAIFQACSLTTSNNLDSKLYFNGSAQNLAIGGDCNIGSSSGFSFQVANGSTVNIDTFQIPGTGTFTLDNGGALKATYGTISGNVATTGVNNTGAYNEYAIARSATGSGTVTYLAATPQNTNVSDTSLSLRKYYTVTADAGVTAGQLYIYYDVTNMPPTMTETNMVIAKYTGIATGWAPMGPYADQADPRQIHTTDASGDINGVWAGLDYSLTPVEQSAASGIPGKFFVGQNYPNPFNPSTVITYGIPQASYVTVKVFNLLGQQVAVLFSGHREAGTYPVTFNADRLSSGVYFCRVEAGQSVEVKRMLLTK